MSSKIRVKAAYMDKSSSRFFDNLTPVSTWVDPGVTVADMLPTLTNRFWAVVSSEVLDDDEGRSPKVGPATHLHPSEFLLSFIADAESSHYSSGYS
jgi:hypothetical protein